MTRRTFALALTAGRLYAEPSPKGRAILNKTVDALGGDRFRNLTSRTETGRAYSFYRERITGLSAAEIHTRYLPANTPGKLRMLQRQSFGKKQEESIITNAAEAWELSYKGATPFADERLAQFHETTLRDIFYILRERLDEAGLEIDSLGTDVIENQRVETVQIFDLANRSVTVWLNANTYLPIKQRFFRLDPATRDRREEVTRYTIYRDAGGGVMWPFSTERERDGGKIFQLFADRIVLNEPTPDSMFELSPGVKILKKPAASPLL